MASNDTSPDHRRDPRFVADLTVQVQGDDGNVAGNLRNVSRSGAAIEFEPMLGKPQVVFEIGESVDVQTDIRPTRGVIVRQDANGIAIKFDKPEEDLLEEIVSAVRKVVDGA